MHMLLRLPHTRSTSPQSHILHHSIDKSLESLETKYYPVLESEELVKPIRYPPNMMPKRSSQYAKILSTPPGPRPKWFPVVKIARKMSARVPIAGAISLAMPERI